MLTRMVEVRDGRKMNRAMYIVLGVIIAVVPCFQIGAEFEGSKHRSDAVTVRHDSTLSGASGTGLFSVNGITAISGTGTTANPLRVNADFVPAVGDITSVAAGSSLQSTGEIRFADQRWSKFNSCVTRWGVQKRWDKPVEQSATTRSP